MGQNIPQSKFWSAVCTVHWVECTFASQEKRQELEIVACLACFASLSAILFVSLLILMIECCMPSVISANSAIIGRNDQWPGYWHDDLLLAASASISLSVRKFTTCKCSAAASLAPSSSAQPSASNGSKMRGIATWKKYPEDRLYLGEESMKTPIPVWLWCGGCCTHTEASQNTLGPSCTYIGSAMACITGSGGVIPSSIAKL